MSLPMFDKKRMATTIMERRNKDGSKGAEADVNPEDDSDPSDLKNLAVDFLQAVERKSPSEIADAFEAMFKCCESKPHDEYEADDESQE